MAPATEDSAYSAAATAGARRGPRAAVVIADPVRLYIRAAVSVVVLAASIFGIAVGADAAWGAIGLVCGYWFK